MFNEHYQDFKFYQDFEDNFNKQIKQVSNKYGRDMAQSECAQVLKVIEEMTDVKIVIKLNKEEMEELLTNISIFIFNFLNDRCYIGK